VKTLECLNIPHLSTFVTAASGSEKESTEQREKTSYISDPRKEGNGRAMFNRMLAMQNLPLEEAKPDYEALASVRLSRLSATFTAYFRCGSEGVLSRG